MSKASVRRSKQLSWLLRHGAGEAGLAMDDAGWAHVSDVLVMLDLSPAELIEAVETNDKGRLQLDDDRIRACQGHSLAGMPVTQDALERSWTAIEPDSPLWHGTTELAVRSIASGGIQPGGRTHVHLAPTTTSHVGKRAAVEVLLEVSPQQLANNDVMIFEAPNGVILVRHVPPTAIVGAQSGNRRNALDLDGIHRTLGLRPH
jgi:putative RNA 2'-phosphotransferase